MNHPTSSWLRKGAIPLALVCLAGPALASRTVTSSDSGGPGPTAVASDVLKACNITDSWGPADACRGFFADAEDAAVVQTLVGAYDGDRPAQAWSGGTAINTALFTPAFNDAIVKIDFAQDLAGSFVVVLSGTWTPLTLTVNSPPLVNWSAYYLFDDVEIFDSVLGVNQIMEFRLFGDAVYDPITNNFLGVDVMRGMDINKVSIYRFDVTRTANVPEPSSLLLSALALGALGAAAARTRRRRLASGTAQAD